MIPLPARQAGALDIITVCALGLAGAGIQAHADQLPLWEVGVGVVVLDLPDYPGADERTNYVLPLPFFAYRGDVFKVDRDGVRGLFFKTDASSRERGDVGAARRAVSGPPTSPRAVRLPVRGVRDLHGKVSCSSLSSPSTCTG